MVVVMVVAALAVARLSMLVVDDQLMLRFRQWVVKRWGEDSLPAYLVHCNWCTSMWLAMPIMPAAILLTVGVSIASVTLSLVAIPAASLIAGLIAKVRG